MTYLVGAGRARKRGGFRCHLDAWLEKVRGIHGVPTPYHAPNANALVDAAAKRSIISYSSVNGTCAGSSRNVSHFAVGRAVIGIDGIPDPYDALREGSAETGHVVALPVLGGVQHDDRRAA